MEVSDTELWPSVRLTSDHRLLDNIDRGKLKPQKTGPQIGGGGACILKTKPMGSADDQQFMCDL